MLGFLDTVRFSPNRQNVVNVRTRILSPCPCYLHTDPDFAAVQSRIIRQTNYCCRYRGFSPLRVARHRSRPIFARLQGRSHHSQRIVRHVPVRPGVYKNDVGIHRMRAGPASTQSAVVQKR